MPHTSTSSGLRERIERGEFIIAPGCHDALGARILACQGFEAVYLSGNALSAGLLGSPDIGLLTQTEMAERARAVAAAVTVPLIADADTGYGNANNVARTVRLYEQAGVAALHLEDQVTPKKCGAMDALALIDADEHAEKIRAALAARSDPNLLIIGRSDARLPLGLDEAIRRGQAYAGAGADLVLLEMLQSEEEMRRALREIDAPLMFNWVDGKTPALPQQRFRELGFRILCFPISATLTYARAMQDFAQALRSGDMPASHHALTLAQYQDILGLNDYH
ncbi:oxaloacetate decarboxylase [Bordetella sp. FB-8]|uniref:isocitrate lyase/PEP mutase family protein n=1 Tax=Bordetella sp. FB-8 TaxID=1159870 RepID=UPI00036D9098|nr:isocitrate lyase/PEP mutase family protein [Bordetella sp. FB-8]